MMVGVRMQLRRRGVGGLIIKVDMRMGNWGSSGWGMGGSVSGRGD